MKKYRVIIWGLGSVGRYALKMINSRKSLELVGAIDIDPKKIGKDAGEIFGLPKTGVIVSDNSDEVLKTDADIVLYYTPQIYDEGNIAPTGVTANAKDICKALSSGKNVSTTLPIYYSEKTAPNFFEMINKCALENNVTYVQQGIFPGLFTPYITVVLGAMSGRIDSILVNSGQDDSNNTAPWVQVFGYGKDPETFNMDALKANVATYYGPTVIEVADRCGLEWDEYVVEHEIITAEVEMNPPCNKVLPGTISAHLFKMSCLKDGKAVSAFHFVHKVCHDIQPYPPRDTFIEINGEPNLKVAIEGMLYKVEPFSTSAAPSVNLIPQIVEAEPGFKNALEIPLVSLPK